MITLDVTRASQTEMNLSKIEHALRDAEEGIQHFIDRLHLGDERINYMAIERLRASARIAHAELDAFQYTLR